MKTRMAMLRGMLGVVAAIVVMSFALPAAAQVVLEATRFVEGVSMGKGAGSGQHVSGADDNAAESISLDFSNAGTPPGTHGVATATTSNILPLLADARVDAVDDTDLFGGTATADIDFTFTIDALDPGPVDVIISTAGAVTLDLTAGPPGTGGSGQASATLQIFHGASFVPGANWAASKSCAVQAPHPTIGCSSNTGESFNDSLTATLMVGEVYSGFMRTLVHGQGGGTGFSFHGSAWVDPTVELAAGFDPTLCQIRFSPGITTAGVVPIPAALPLLLSGLAGLGAIGWRRRKES